MTNMAVALSGYQFDRVLYTGTRTLVYRGQRESDNQSVVIKFLRNEYPTFSELLQFRNQYTIAKNLNIPGIIRPESLEPYGNSYALVMEDGGGISLREYSHTHTLELTEVLVIALQLANILHNLHANRVIHKDIKPANILIHPDTKQVKLIDFSIASLLPKETQEIKNPNGLEGTLAYLAPEQTGRMNRGIDYRSDFYALGVTLFELFAGQLPFESDDAMELVHSHIAKQPPSLSEFNISKAISAIVMKLMTKNAEDRYQSALGLKYDLEICLNQLKKTGTIEPFEIGTRDVCDRFIIPEKLYGRETEVQTLLNAFERVSQGSSELMLVAGFSGIGKTAVVNEVHKPIVRQRGYFIKGKFDQFNRNIPFSAWVQAFRDLMGQVLSESHAQLATWKAKILQAVGENGQVIIDVIPELEHLIGKQPSVPELSGSAAQNRFNLLFQKFIQVFTTPEHPLVMFLDDLQWADSASLNLLSLLMSETRSGYLLILGAYRDNEVFPAHPLMLTLENIEKAHCVVNTITLEPLTETTVNQFVADTLSCSAELAKPLTELVYRKTKGNPFFTTQFLKALYEEGWIEFQRDLGYWQCELTVVRQLALTDDVVEFMAQQLQKLPVETQAVLKLAACIGNQFDLRTLALVSERSQTDAATALWKALQEGLVIPQNEVYKFYVGNESQKTTAKLVENVTYRFLHDRVQQAAYSLIPEAQKQANHWQIGQLLLTELPQKEQIDRIFDIANQLNLGKTTSSSPAQKKQLAQLNLQAGQKAKLSAAYQAAHNYYEIGIDLLPIETWQTDYSLMYDLHQNAAEVAYLCGNFDRAEALYPIALKQAKIPLDKAMIYRVQMTQYQLQGRNAEAIVIQRQSLQLLGWSMPTDPEKIQASLDEQIATVNRFLDQQTIESILDLAKMTDENTAEILRILQILFYAAWLDGQPTLALLALAKMTTLSLQYGNSEMSPFGYVGYGLILNSLLKKAAQAHQFGCMAVQLCEQFDNADVRGMTNFLFAADVHSWSRPLREADTYYDNAFKYGMDAGNWLTVGFMMMQSGSDRLTYGKNLNELYAIVQTHTDFLRRIKSLENLDALIVGVLQPIRQLLGLTNTPFSFDDESFSESDYLQRYSNAPYHLAWFYSVKIRHTYLFEGTSTYLDLIPKLSIIETTISSHAKVPSSVFYVILMHLALVEGAKNEAQCQEYWQAIEPLEERLNRWEKDCPENIRHKCLLIQAEKARLSGQKAKAIECYEQAIVQAQVQGYSYEAALANELAAKFYLNWGKEKVASGYMQDAYYCYAKWGAKAKTDDLEKCYPQLLRPILQSGSVASTNFRKTVHPTQTSSGTSTSNLLDFNTFTKAAQALYSEIHLDKLLAVIMEVMVENAGADKAALVLNQDDELTVAIEYTDGSVQLLASQPLDTCDHFPVSIIRQVSRTLKPQLRDRLDDPKFAAEPYFAQHSPQSLLCSPIIHQGKLIGILYLENSSSSGAFTHDRLEILHLLCAQAAISLENASLYNTLEQKVIDRTRELSQALDDLKATQKQLVEAEKMAALGGLVAGVAHEINTPVGVGITLASTLVEATQDFKAEIAGGQLKKSVLTSYLETAEDSASLMLTNLQRAGDLIQSFKQVAVDRTNLEQRSIDLKPYLEEIATSLSPQLRQARHTLTVTGDDSIAIVSYPGAIAQLITNLLNNSLLHAYSQGEAGQLQIDIQHSEHSVILTYSDDGCGIPPEHLDKIFDPFFTTARDHGGSGLGLHIVYNLVIQKLGGTLEVESTVGKGTVFAIELPWGL
jgi:predicted ATPase/signal transduction histidine kinase